MQFSPVIILATLCIVPQLTSSAPVTTNSHGSNSHWLPAVATWYGSANGDGSDGKHIIKPHFTLSSDRNVKTFFLITYRNTGGACGYGTLVDVKPLHARVGAVNPILFKNGEGCGACYKVRCLDRSICSRRAVTVIITDECPGCSKTNTHFDLSGAAFGRLAISGESGPLRNRGLIPVIYRRYMLTLLLSFKSLINVYSLHQ